MRSELVVGVDGSAASYAAVGWTAQEATIRGLPVRLVHVVAPTSMSSTEAPNDTITHEQEVKARHVIDQARRIVDGVQGEARLKVRVEIRYAGVLATLVDASSAPAGSMSLVGTCSARSVRVCSITRTAR